MLLLLLSVCNRPRHALDDKAMHYDLIIKTESNPINRFFPSFSFSISRYEEINSIKKHYIMESCFAALITWQNLYFLPTNQFFPPWSISIIQYLCRTVWKYGETSRNPRHFEGKGFFFYSWQNLGGDAITFPVPTALKIK